MKNIDNQNSEWPYKSLLLFGFFGPGTPSGKRLVIRSTYALILFIFGAVGTQLIDLSVWRILSALCMPIAIGIIVFANVIYVRSLDSLEKLIQLSAFSASYGAAILIGITLFAFNTVTDLSISPLWLLLAEPFRGICLYFISRRYL
jgi:hypothetical protein